MKSNIKNIIMILLFFAIGLAGFVYNNASDITSLIIAVVLFALGFVLLIKGGDYFVDGATAVAEKFKVPELLIGATVVSIGTTLPEVMVSAQAAVKGNSGISYGNAIGSIICNVSLIAAITLIAKPAKVKKKPLYFPVVFFFVAAIYYAVNAYVFQNFSLITGIILLCMFVVYMIVNIKQALSPKKDEESEEAAEEEEKKDIPIYLAIIMLVLGAAIIAFGATLLVDNGTIIASKLGVPDSVIALTVVALGTSLPELVTAITSLIKGHGALSLGNIIGANIFNLVLVSGLAITLKPFPLPEGNYIAGINSSLIVDVPLMFIVMMLLTLPPVIKGKLYRWQGITLIVIYVAFCVFQFAMGMS